MPRLNLRQLEQSDVAAAGRLLAARHARHREQEPLLAARFAEAAAAADEVAALLAVEGSSAAVATVGGEMVGFVIGTPKPAPTWGPNMWVEAAGHAYADDPEVMRDLYGFAAQAWVDAGRTAHFVVVPAADPGLVDAWFHLSFGLQHVHAIQEARIAARPTLVPGLQIREATRDDIAALARLDPVLPEHQARSPVFSQGAVPTEAETVEEWAEIFDDHAFATFVAVRGTDVLGAAIGCPLEKSSTHVSLSRPEGAGFLGWAAVLQEARGLGLGRALGEAVTSWAAAHDLSSVVTDWRATNLLSSRTWPRLGFRPTFLRLHRVIGY